MVQKVKGPKLMSFSLKSFLSWKKYFKNMAADSSLLECPESAVILTTTVFSSWPWDPEIRVWFWCRF